VRRGAAAVAQIVLLSLLSVGFDRGARAIGSPVPGSVIGAIVLAALLLFGIVPLRWVARGADLLLTYLALFFVPAAVSAMRVFPSIRNDLLAITVIAVSTTIGILLLTGKLAARWERE
jgi:holin-like protein